MEEDEKLNQGGTTNGHRDLWCGLPSVQGAIDGTNLLISKPSMPFLEEYYHYKKICIFN